MTGTISLADSDLDEITTSGAIILGDASSAGLWSIGGAIQPPGARGPDNLVVVPLP